MPSGQANGEKVVWDDANEKHLLLLILASANPKGMDWSEIAAGFGRGLTAGAASQKYGKIKKRDAEIFNRATGAGTPSPTKKGASTPKSSGKRSRKTTNDEDDDDEETPVKKQKGGKKETKKDESDEEISLKLEDYSYMEDADNDDGFASPSLGI